MLLKSSINVKLIDFRGFFVMKEHFLFHFVKEMYWILSELKYVVLIKVLFSSEFVITSNLLYQSTTLFKRRSLDNRSNFKLN